MQVTEEILKKAKKDAMDNYSTWGQWIVECYDDDELRESLEDVDSYNQWIKVRKAVADHHQEIESTTW